MATPSPQTRILRRAAGEIGYSRWTDPNRGTKYARETQPALWPQDTWLLANGIAFCDIFVTWVFWKEGLLSILPAGASYNTDYRASKGGRVSKPPRPGDVLVFDWNWSTPATNHVGILERVLPSGNYQTIEGNTSPGSSGSQSNGGGVYRRVRRPGQVRHVIRPRWARAGGSAPSAPARQPWEKSPRIRGMSKAEVRRIQQMLVDANNNIGPYGVDGSYGKDTFDAVKRVQKALGLTVDGIFGPATERALRNHIAGMGKKPAKGAGKLKVDGRFGRKTAKALQRFLNSRIKTRKLKVDGRIGPESWKSLQEYLNQAGAGIKVDGLIEHQSYRHHEIGDGISQNGWVYANRRAKGSKTIRALQEWVGAGVDGTLYEGTTKALQRKLNQHGVGM